MSPHYRRIRLFLLLSSAICCAAIGIAGIQTRGAISITLEKMILPNSAPLYGMTNIFFEDPGSSAIRRLETWKDVKLARIVGNPALKPVDALQYRDETGTVQIVVDTDSDGDWQDEKRLVFERSGDSLFADFKIRFVPPDGNAPSADPVSYQIIRTGPYVYARIREYRTGRLQIGDDSYAVLLRPESRENPLYGSGRTLLFIDLDRNGEIAQFWEERKTGELMPSEQVSVAQPFLLAGRKFEVESLDPEGTQLILKPTTVDIGVSPGFLAPSLEAQDLEGRIHSLQDLRGKVVLLEFWSVDCPWADTVRPLINAVAEKFKGPEFAVLSVAREKDPTVLRDYLKAKPKSTIVLRRDDNAWKIFNPDGMTPLCFVLDRGGVIRLIAPGARSQKALEAAIAGLITAR